MGEWWRDLDTKIADLDFCGGHGITSLHVRRHRLNPQVPNTDPPVYVSTLHWEYAIVWWFHRQPTLLATIKNGEYKKA